MTDLGPYLDALSKTVTELAADTAVPELLITDGPTSADVYAASRTAALIPYAGDDPDRTQALAHVTAKLAADGITTVTGAGSTDPWCKADAIADALARTSADILVIHDADVWCNGTLAAVTQVALGAPWAVPHRMVRRLDAHGTTRVYRGDPYSTELRVAERPYLGHPGGGITVVSRRLYERCPLDPRFTGWGQEDDAWALALTTLAGKPWRGTSTLWHHWHLPQARRDRFVGSDAGAALYGRYTAASGDPAAMAALVDEARFHGFRPRHLMALPAVAGQ